MKSISSPRPRTYPSVLANRMKTSLTPQTWSLVPLGGRSACWAFLLESGRATLALSDGESVELLAPALAWVPTNFGVSYSLEAGSSGFNLSVSDEFVWRTIGDISVASDLKFLMDDVTVALNDSLPFDEVANSFSAMVREMGEPAPGGTSIVGFHLGLVLLHVWRALGALDATTSPKAGGATLVQRFRQLVDAHFREAYRLEEYAQRLGVTRSRLHDTCMRIEGATPLSIIHHRVLEEAQRRLIQTEMSVEQVAYSLGFKDAPYFNRFFTRMTGSNPGAFRKAAISTARPVTSTSFAAWP